MAFPVTEGAVCRCPFGTVPCTLHATTQPACFVGGRPVATIQDAAPGTNLTGFGMCGSLLNPAVASATAAALGALTPQACTFAPAGLWTAVNPKLRAGGMPLLATGAVLTCAVGWGCVKIATPGQRKVIS